MKLLNPSAETFRSGTTSECKFQKQTWTVQELIHQVDIENVNFSSDSESYAFDLDEFTPLKSFLRGAIVPVPSVPCLALSDQTAGYCPSITGVIDVLKPAQVILRPSLPQEMLECLDAYLQTLPDSTSSGINYTLNTALQEAQSAQVRSEITDVHPVYNQLLRFVSAAINHLTQSTFRVAGSFYSPQISVANDHDIFTSRDAHAVCAISIEEKTSKVYSKIEGRIPNLYDAAYIGWDDHSACEGAQSVLIKVRHILRCTTSLLEFLVSLR